MFSIMIVNSAQPLTRNSISHGNQSACKGLFEEQSSKAVADHWALQSQPRDQWSWEAIAKA
jgi:hypothetical protein